MLLNIAHKVYNWYAAIPEDRPTGLQMLSILAPALGLLAGFFWRLECPTFIPRPWRPVVSWLRNWRQKYLLPLPPENPPGYVPWIYMALTSCPQLLGGEFETRVDPLSKRVEKRRYNAPTWVEADLFDKAVVWGAMHAKIHPPLEVTNFPVQAANTNSTIAPLIKYHSVPQDAVTTFRNSLEIMAKAGCLPRSIYVSNKFFNEYVRDYSNGGSRTYTALDSSGKSVQAKIYRSKHA